MPSAQDSASIMPSAAPPVLCAGAYSPNCGVSAESQKSARELYDAGVKLKKEGHGEDAFEDFRQAALLVPRNVEYATARELLKQQLVLERMRQGESELAAGREVPAMAAFRAALEIDPGSAAAAERLREVAHINESSEQRSLVAGVQATRPELIEVRPRPGVHNFHLRTDTRSLLTQVAQAYGITAHVDDTLSTRAVRFDLDNADFGAAMSTAQLMATAFWVPISEHDILVEPDTPLARTQFERHALETFYFPNAGSPQDLNEIMNMLRGVLDARQLTINTHANAIVLRGPVRMLREAEQAVAALQDGRPQVVIDVSIYQVSHTLLRDLGVQLPLQFTMFNLSNVQQLLASSNLGSVLGGAGGIGAALLAQSAASQNPQLSALLANPLATFGGGKTLFGVGIPPATLRLSMNSSNIKQLDHLSLRVQQGTDASFHFGERFPVLTASYSAVYNIPGLSQLTNGQNLAAFPSFNYQDLGLTVKATPTVHALEAVTLKIDTQVQALGASSVNGVPVIDNRQYQGTINLKDGETAVVASSVDEQDVRNIQGIPALSRIPLLGYAVSEHHKDINDDEVLITITPHIVYSPVKREQVIVMTP